jgi:hypothetical protein
MQGLDHFSAQQLKSAVNIACFDQSTQTCVNRRCQHHLETSFPTTQQLTATG